jgi:DNA-binding response OmpR family regulator
VEKNSVPVPPLPEAAAELRPLRVLLIEDDEDAMLLVQTALQKHGQGNYLLEWANSLNGGLSKLAKGGVDIIVLDLGLPDSSGPSGFARIREAAPGIPVLVLTGNACIEMEFAVLAGGVDDYLEKSQTQGSALLKVIAAVLEEKKRRERLKHLGTGHAYRPVANTFWGM